jgi:hypothetical protein
MNTKTRVEPFGAGWIAEPELLERELRDAEDRGKAAGIAEERARWLARVDLVRSLVVRWSPDAVQLILATLADDDKVEQP